MTEHNHPNLIPPGICIIVVFGAGTILELPLIVAILNGQKVYDLSTEALVSVILGISLYVAGAIMLKQFVDIIDRCEKCG